jgi:hypothetical protein
MRTTPDRSPRTRIAFWIVSLALMGSLLGVFASPGISAEPWKPAGELARVKFDKDFGLILIPVTVDGQAHQFVLDTGCSAVIVDTTLAKDLRQRSKRQAGTSGEDVEISVHAAPQLAIANLSCDWIGEIGAMDLTPFRKVIGKDFQGIIGMQLLCSMILHIDYDNGLVVLCDGQSDSIPPGAPTPLILDDSLSPKILVRPRGVDGAVFLVDTGAGGTGSFDKALTSSLRRAGAITPTGNSNQLLRGDGSVATIALERCAEVEVAGHRHANLIVSEGKSNALGARFLRRHRVTLDFAHEKAYFEPGELFALRDRSDYDGIVIDDEMIVRGVVPDSVAEKAGLKVSDRLAAIGSIKSTGDNWPALSAELTTPRATPLVITVERDGKEQAITIPGG